MFASLAHHLCAPCIPLYRHIAHRTPLYIPVTVIEHHRLHVPPSSLDQQGSVLRACDAGVPRGRAEAAELLGAGGAGDWHSLGLGTQADVADSVATSGGAPRSSCVDRHFCVKTKSPMFVHQIFAGKSLHLVLVEDSLLETVRIGAGNVVGSLHHFKRYVLLDALLAESASAILQLDHEI